MQKLKRFSKKKIISVYFKICTESPISNFSFFMQYKFDISHIYIYIFFWQLALQSTVCWVNKTINVIKLGNFIYKLIGPEQDYYTVQVLWIPNNMYI